MRNPQHFPDDLIYAILSRLPTKSVIRFRCVSKTWNSFIHDPYFLQLRQSISHTLNLFLFVCPNPSDWGVYSSQPRIFLEQLPIHEDQGHLQLKSSTSIHSMPNLHCCDLDVQSVNGLLCFHPKHENRAWFSSKQARVTTHVCNPTTRQFVTLPHDNTIDFDLDFKIFTNFGYDPLQDKFKVLRIILNQGKFYELRILTVGDYVWRNITHVIPFDLRSDINPLKTIGTCVNSAIHWVDFTSKVLRVFGVEREQFRDIPIPDGLENYELIELGGYLSLFRCRMNGFIELSILKDYQNHVWIHERIILPAEIPLTEGYYLPTCKVSTGEILLLPSYLNNYLIRVYYYDTKKRSCRSILLSGIRKFFYTVLCLGGLRMFRYQENFMLL